MNKGERSKEKSGIPLMCRYHIGQLSISSCFWILIKNSSRTNHLILIFVIFISFSEHEAFGENQNRQVSISKLTNQISQTLADYRRADIFARNQILTAFIRISRCK